jgi:hypothetical protein
MLAIREVALQLPTLDEASLKKARITKKQFEAAIAKTPPRSGDFAEYARLGPKRPEPEVA